jgi:hypothetical protein
MPHIPADGRYFCCCSSVLRLVAGGGVGASGGAGTADARCGWRWAVRGELSTRGPRTPHAENTRRTQPRIGRRPGGAGEIRRRRGARARGRQGQGQATAPASCSQPLPAPQAWRATRDARHGRCRVPSAEYRRERGACVRGTWCVVRPAPASPAPPARVVAIQSKHKATPSAARHYRYYTRCRYQIQTGLWAISRLWAKKCTTGYRLLQLVD